MKFLTPQKKTSSVGHVFLSITPFLFILYTVNGSGAHKGANETLENLERLQHASLENHGKYTQIPTEQTFDTKNISQTPNLRKYDWMSRDQVNRISTSNCDSG